jgi:hypothetical protein
MSTDRETTRLVRSWLEEGVTSLPDRVLDAVLDQLPATPQRRAWWPAWRFSDMNTYVKFAIAAAAVLVVAVVGYNFLPGRGGVGGPAATPSPSPAPLAVGNFVSHGLSAQLDARGAGANVTGTMTVSELRPFNPGSSSMNSPDSGLRAAVALECTLTTDGGLIVIGGLVTDSTFDDNFPEGRRVAIIFQRGPPVKAVWYIALVAEPLVETCQALVEDVIVPEEVSPGLEPIEGTVELAP